jgi:hypothetical protein
MITLVGCEATRVEYHKRPAFYQQASDQELPDEVILPDGTKIVYQPVNERRAQLDPEKQSNVFRPRDQLEDGTIVLRAIMPEHVLYNTLACIKNEEYALLWDQMVSQRTKTECLLREQSFEDFATWCAKHRVELAQMLNRMRHGMLHNDVILESVEPGVFQYRFQPRVGELFKFKRVLVSSEPPNGFKLLVIK